MPSPKPPTNRQLKVGEQLRHALASMLARDELRDPILQEVSVTVTEVRMTPDLRTATIFVMPLTGERSDEVHEALKRSIPFLRGRLGRTVRLRFTPNLRFEIDTRFEDADRMDRLLRSVTTGSGPDNPSRDEDD